MMRKAVLICLVFLVFGGCTVKGTYNRLDWVLAKYLNSYVELTDTQERELREYLASTLYWHRTTQLPLYINWLQSVKQDVVHGLTEAQVEQHTLELLLYWRALMVRFADDMAVLLPELSPQQRAELFASFIEKNDEYQADYIKVSQQQQQKNYTERLQDSFDSWLGSLSLEQKKSIQAAAVQMQPIAAESLQTRIRWQQELHAILENHQDLVTTREAMHRLFVDTETLRSATYKHMLEHNRQVVSRLIVDISRTLSDKQRQYFNKRVDKYIKLFSELTQDATPRQAASQCATC
jgi:hypothetical protein